MSDEIEDVDGLIVQEALSSRETFDALMQIEDGRAALRYVKERYGKSGDRWRKSGHWYVSGRPTGGSNG